MTVERAETNYLEDLESLKLEIEFARQSIDMSANLN